MTLMLDTSMLIGLERTNSVVISRLREISQMYAGEPVIPFISYYEYYEGLQMKNPKNRGQCLILVESFQMLVPTKQTAHIISDLKRKYSQEGLSLALGDLMIAAQAIENNFTLVTMDEHFERISELKKVIIK